jgi:hypothetical protein
MRAVKVNVNGNIVDGKQVDYATVGEPWCEYELENGRRARLKVVLTRVVETEERNPAGQKIYSFDCQPVFIVDGE